MEWVPNFIIQCSIYLQAVEKNLYNWIKKIMYDQTRIYQMDISIYHWSKN